MGLIGRIKESYKEWKFRRDNSIAYARPRKKNKAFKWPDFRKAEKSEIEVNRAPKSEKHGKKEMFFKGFKIPKITVEIKQKKSDLKKAENSVSKEEPLKKTLKKVMGGEPDLRNTGSPISSLSKMLKIGSKVEKIKGSVNEITRKKFRKIYSFFLLLGFLLSLLALLKSDWFSYAISLLVMFFAFLSYRDTVADEEKKLAFYIAIWPLLLAIAVASIAKRNILAFSLSALGMFISSLTPMLLYRKARQNKMIKMAESMGKSEKRVETDFDKLLELINQMGKIKISEISQIFNIGKEKAEEWARIMEENRFAQMHYPAFGEAELRKWEKKKEEVQ